MRLYELTFENILIPKAACFMLADNFDESLILSTNLTIDLSRKSVRSCYSQLESLIIGKEEQVFINFDSALIGDYFIDKPSVQFIKYNHLMDVNFLFDHGDILSEDNLINSLKRFAKRMILELNGASCFFGLEPAFDVDNRIFEINP